MRLTITLPELTAGASTQTGREDRLTKLQFDAERKEPTAITPLWTHDRKIISVILLTEATRIAKGIELKFRPIWNKTFLHCSMKKDSLLSLFIEFDFGKYQIDKNKAYEANVTTSGNGCDPVIVQKSQTELSDLLNDERRSDVLLNAIKFMKERC